MNIEIYQDIPVKNVSFVFLKNGNAYGFESEADKAGKCRGRLVPLHKESDEGETPRSAAYEAMTSAGIDGEIEDICYYLEYGRMTFNYFHASVEDIGKSKKMYWINEDKITSDKRVAEWVPGMMKKMGLI